MAGSGTGFQRIGVVEGFYGRVWSEAERETFIAALLPFGLNTYLYAPKHEAALGPDLLEPLDGAASRRLEALHRFCRENGIALSAGLHLEPPFDPAREEHLQRLGEKALALAELGIGGFAVLFDDVPSARSPLQAGVSDPFAGSLAAAQARAFNSLYEGLSGQGLSLSWLICPGRYTLDPMLEREYGAFEPDYLQRLHSQVPQDVPWLWTGPQVVPETVTLADRDAYLAELGPQGVGRPLVLWDNYPVNDASMQPWLHLDPLGGRAPDLPQGVAGYLFNPLLQPHLGRIPGATCLAYANDPAGYDPTAAWQRALRLSLPEPLHMPFAELAALTRPPEGKGGLPPAWPRGSFPVAERLRRAWPALSQGEPVEPYVISDFVRAVETLQRDLPREIREEARPWLNRLRLVMTLFQVLRDGAPPETVGPLRAQYAARDGAGPPAEVLGPWFP